VLDRNRPLPRLTSVTDEQVTEITRISFDYPYNFAPAPRPETKVTVAEFVRDSASEFPYSIRDLADKLKMDYFSAESFAHHVDKALLATPGHLSAVTVAKLIHYCLQILESEAEILVWGRICRGVPGTPDANDIANAVAAKANRYGSADNVPEYDHVGQFLAAVKHPIVGKAVSNAAINRWGANERIGLPRLDFWGRDAQEKGGNV
jgi:hypothetical protein